MRLFLMRLFLTLTLCATVSGATTEADWEATLNDLDAQIHEVSLVNLVRGLNLTRKQATELRKLALEIEKLAPKQSADRKHPAEMQNVLSAYRELNETLLAGRALTPELDRRVTQARNAHAAFVRSTLKAEPQGADIACVRCHQAPQSNHAAPPTRTPQYLKDAELAHCSADYGIAGLVKLVELSPHAEALLTEAQRAIFSQFTCCLQPPDEMGDPVRAGQAQASAKELDLLRKARAFPAAQWPAARAEIRRRAGETAAMIRPGLAEDARAKAADAYVTALERARKVGDAEFEMEKGDLAAALHTALFPAQTDTPHKVAFFLLVPGSARIYERYAADLEKAGNK